MHQGKISQDSIDDIFGPMRAKTDGYWAIGLVIGYFLVKLAGYYVVFALIAGAVMMAGDRASAEHLIRSISPVARLFSDFFAGGLFILLAVKVYGIGRLVRRDASSPAWRVGGVDAVGEGALWGACSGALTLLFVAGYTLFGGTIHIEPAANDLVGYSVFVIGLLSAPFFEELIFRGVLFGFTNAGFGFVCAVLLTTGGFVLPHYWDRELRLWSFSVLLVISGLTLWIRLRKGAVGPAIGLHIVHNGVVGVFALATAT